MASMKVNVGTLPRDLDKFLQELHQFPAGRLNPLISWRVAFGARTMQAGRPGVGTAGEFRGNYWPALEPAYTRGGTAKHPQVQDVPVWGGVERWRAGRVTRATDGGQRYLKYMTGAQIKGATSNIGAIKIGQTFTGGTVLAKLRSDGTRYAQSDAQLGKDAQTGLLGDFSYSDPVVTNNNRTVRVTSAKAYAAAIHDRRPFATGPQIDREEEQDVLEKCTQYVDFLLKRLDGGR